MLNEVVTETNIIYYLMVTVGVIGVLAKAANQITLRRLVGAAANMSKSTHKLIKLIRSKYEHACMLHDKVENTEAFVEKYIYEYRGMVFRLHTWRQMERLTVWFAGVLAAAGAFCWYMKAGFCEEMYRYIALGAAEMLVLYVVGQLSDEPYKITAAKNYMVDYLENVCAYRYKKLRQSEKEQIDVIQPENSAAMNGAVMGSASVGNSSVGSVSVGNAAMRSGAIGGVSMSAAQDTMDIGAGGAALRRTVPNSAAAGGNAPTEEDVGELAINIEGAPRKVPKGEAARQIIRHAVKEKPEEDDEPALREETIRQILKEFLA